MKRVFSLVPVLILLGSFSLACSFSDAETEAHVADACKSVTTENWYTSEWGRRSPSELCSHNAWVSEGMTPCTLGNLPFLCRRNEGNVGVYDLGGVAIAFLNPEDEARVGDGLKFIR